MDEVPKELIEVQKKSRPVENRLGTTDKIAQIVGLLAEEESFGNWAGSFSIRWILYVLKNTAKPLFERTGVFM